ncbi:MAG: hypothetical protein IJ756_09040 [Paludibacteraceae bacterium]|nr:hypothetical protein [Paludibacteraceae bacterium]
MQRILFLLISVLQVIISFADEFEVDNFTGEIKGQVKQVTISLSLSQPTANNGVSMFYGSNQTTYDNLIVIYYDTLGRIVEKDNYVEVGVAYIDLYEYYEHGYIVRNVDKTGNYTNHVKYVFADSGIIHKELVYEGDSLLQADSMFYNYQNLLVGKFSYSIKKQQWEVKYTCKYDSLSRLIGVRRNDSSKSGFNVVYDENGNYVRQIINNGKIIDKETYTFDKNGNLTKIRSNQIKYTYSKFDNYGNWTKCLQEMRTEIGWMGVEYNRQIEYY